MTPSDLRNQYFDRTVKSMEAEANWLLATIVISVGGLFAAAVVLLLT